MFYMGVKVTCSHLYCCLLLDGAEDIRNKAFRNHRFGHMHLSRWLTKQGCKLTKVNAVISRADADHQTAALRLSRARLRVSLVSEDWLRRYAATLTVDDHNPPSDILALARLGKTSRPKYWKEPPPEKQKLLVYLRHMRTKTEQLQQQQVQLAALLNVPYADPVQIEVFRQRIEGAQKNMRRLQQRIDQHLLCYPVLSAFIANK